MTVPIEQLVTRLTSTSSQLHALHARARTLETERNDLVRQALAAGWTHTTIATLSGLTRGRIGQLATSRRPEGTS